MRSNAVQIVFYLFAFVAAAAAQEALPAVGGVKPALVAAVAFRLALTRRAGPALAGALAAGGLCDALSSLPGLCTAGYLMAVCALAALLRGTDSLERSPGRRGRPDLKVSSPLFAASLFAAAAPAGELWTRFWVRRLDASLALGLPFAAAAGFAAAFALYPLLDALERLCGIPHDAAERGMA